MFSMSCIPCCCSNSYPEENHTMEFVTHSFRHAEVILNELSFKDQYLELVNVVKNVKDDDIINKHRSAIGVGGRKSISTAINALLKERFICADWKDQSAIFQDESYQEDHWRLDFAKRDISIEVAFNHGEAIAWNLIKPVLASELNHVK